MFDGTIYIQKYSNCVILMSVSYSFMRTQQSSDEKKKQKKGAKQPYS